MKFRQLLEGWDVSETTDGLTGTRVFIPDENGKWDRLPEGIDAFITHREDTETVDTSFNVSGLVVKERKVQIMGKPNQVKYVVTYATLNAKSEMSSELNLDSKDLPRSFSLSAETIEVTNTQGVLKWDDNNVAVDSSVRIYRHSGVLPFTLKKRVRNLDGFLSAAWVCLGGVNAERFGFLRKGKGFPGQTVLFTGLEGSEMRDRRGRRVWLLDIHFSARRVTGKDEDGKDGWNHVLRPTDMEWILVKPALFPVTDGFSAMVNFRD